MSNNKHAVIRTLSNRSYDCDESLYINEKLITDSFDGDTTVITEILGMFEITSEIVEED